MKEYIRYGIKNEDGTVNWGDWTENSGEGGLSGTVGSTTQPVYLADGNLMACDFSSSWAFYTSQSQIGLTTSATISQIYSAMPVNSIFTSAYSDFDDGSQLPEQYGMVWFVKGSSNNRGSLWFYGKSSPQHNYRMYLDSSGIPDGVWYIIPHSSPATVGSSTNPVYLNSGTVTACNDYGIVSGYSKSSNGYIKFSNGIILQWGSGSTGGAQYVDTTFPTSFSSTNYVVVVTDRDNSISTSWSHNSICIATSYSSASKFRAVADYDMEAFWYVAVGY